MLLLLLVIGCSDYGFDGAPDAKHADTGAPPTAGDTAPPPGDTGDPGADTGPPPDSGTTDSCYEPEHGYTINPAARIFTTDGTTPITLTYVSSDTSYDDQLWIDTPVSAELAQGGSSAPGTSMTLGPYPVGTELVFATQVVTTGDHWQSGPGTRNRDGVVHGAATYEGGCAWLIGFEDLDGGGDLDYNDIVMEVSGMLQQVD